MLWTYTVLVCAHLLYRVYFPNAPMKESEWKPLTLHIIQALNTCTCILSHVVIYELFCMPTLLSGSFIGHFVSSSVTSRLPPDIENSCKILQHNKLPLYEILYIASVGQTQIPGTRSLWQIHILQWHLISVLLRVTILARRILENLCTHASHDLMENRHQVCNLECQVYIQQ